MSADLIPAFPAGSSSSKFGSGAKRLYPKLRVVSFSLRRACLSEDKQTLITGFGAFGKVKSNPCEKALAHFSGQVTAGQLITTCLLPVSYSQAPLFLEMALRAGGKHGAPFDFILMLGVAAGSSGWRVERFGRNFNGSAPDIEGVSPPPSIVQEAPEILEATLPVEDIRLALEAVGLPVVISESAGDYLCNHIFYRALWELRCSGSQTLAGFLHIPADTDTFDSHERNTIAFSHDQHLLAVEAALIILQPDFEEPNETIAFGENFEF